MKFQFTSKSKAVAEKFAQSIKADRNIDSSLTEKDGTVTVEYSTADYAEPAREATAVTYADLESMCSYLYREMQYQTNWLSSAVSELDNALWKHRTEGHLPAIIGPEKMQKAIEALGLAGDYEVQKRVVYASNASIEVDFVK